MTPKDTISLIDLAIGIVLAGFVAFLIRRGKLRPEMWPRVLGIGAGLVTFLILMTLSIADATEMSLVEVARNSLLWSLALGIIGYVAGRIFLTRSRGRR